VRYALLQEGSLSLQLVLIVVALALILQFLVSEFVRGRFARMDVRPAGDPRWLEANLFTHPPEVVGAAWRGAVSASEVAATLARLTVEGKIRSHASSDAVDLICHLAADRDDLGGEDRVLIDTIFPGGWRETSTTSLRHHSRGFFKLNLPTLLRPGLRRRVAALVGEPKMSWPHRIVPLASFVAAAVLLVSAAPLDAAARVAGVYSFVAILLGVPGLRVARDDRRRVDWGFRSLAVPLAPSLVVVGFAWTFAGNTRWAHALAAGAGDTSALFVAATQTSMACLAIALTSLFLDASRTRERAAGIAVRKRLAAARAYFAQELSVARPLLRDEWFPYVLALGLEDASRRWILLHGSSALSHRETLPAATPEEGAWSGGGRAFGGGASVFWASAASLFAVGGEDEMSS
jgi:hypothetical protein